MELKRSKEVGENGLMGGERWLNCSFLSVGFEPGMMYIME